MIQIFPRELTPVQACELAAWLVVMSEVAMTLDFRQRDERELMVDEDFDPEAHFHAALEAVRNS